eukprot:sb/3472362/
MIISGGGQGGQLENGRGFNSGSRPDDAGPTHAPGGAGVGPDLPGCSARCTRRTFNPKLSPQIKLLLGVTREAFLNINKYTRPNFLSCCSKITSCCKTQPLVSHERTSDRDRGRDRDRDRDSERDSERQRETARNRERYRERYRERHQTDRVIERERKVNEICHYLLQ